MSRGRIAAVALTGAIVAGGTGAAIAAVGTGAGKNAEQAVLDDAAARLNVAPEKLRDALAAAQDAQIEEAVEAGSLTQGQADAIKAARKQSGRVLGPFGGPRPHRGGLGGARAFGMRHGMLDDIAKALGTTPAKLFASLRAGTSIADMARAGGISLADLRSAVKAAVKTRLDTAVQEGDLTQKQADATLARVGEKREAIESGTAPRLRRHRERRGGMPPRGEMRPGGLLPPGEAPQLVPRHGTYG